MSIEDYRTKTSFIINPFTVNHCASRTYLPLMLSPLTAKRKQMMKDATSFTKHSINFFINPTVPSSALIRFFSLNDEHRYSDKHTHREHKKQRLKVFLHDRKYTYHHF